MYTEKDIYKIFESSFKEILSVLEDEIKHIVKNRILEYQVEEYKRNYQTKTFIHRVVPVNLYDIYVNLDLELSTNNFYPIDNKIISTENISDVFKDSNFISIIGTAGSGKSTLTKHLLVNSIATNYKIPIKIELRNLNYYGKSILEYINEKVFKLNKIATSERIIDRLLKNGQFVIILDGYDELKIETKEKINENIEEITKLYPQNKYLLTSRPYSNAESLNSFSTYYVCNLTPNQVEEFIHKQFHGSRPELAKNIIESIYKQENKPFRSFISNPLLLSMFLLTYQIYSNIPPSKTTFYWQVFDTIYCLHDSIEKASFERVKTSGLIKEEFINILEIFSYITLIENKLIYHKQYLYKKFDYIKSKKKNLEFENDKLLYDITSAICILVQDGLDYSFPHKSLQEYFAALFVSKLSLDSKVEFYKKTLSYFTKISYNNQVFPYANFYSLLLELDYKIIRETVILEYFAWFRDELQISLNSEPRSDFTRVYSGLRSSYDFFINMHSFSFSVPDTNSLIKGFGNFTLNTQELYNQRINEIIGSVQEIIENLIQEIDESNEQEIDILELR